MKIAYLFSMSVLVFITSCETMPLAASNPNRLEVTDELRTACANWQGRDQDIRSFILAAEADRLNGVTFQDQIAVTARICQDAPDALFQINCNNCGTAVIAQVYEIR